MQRSPELEDLVSQWFAAATRGDASVVDDYVSAHPETCLIGSDPGEWFRGGEAVAQFLRGEVISAGKAAQFSPEGTEAFEEGTVGWATTMLTITLPDGRHVSPRWSSVFHRDDDSWRFVHTHASIGVGNADVGWIYPDRPRWHPWLRHAISPSSRLRKIITSRGNDRIAPSHRGALRRRRRRDTRGGRSPLLNWGGMTVIKHIRTYV